jgi:hypothetical protein
VSVLAAFLMVRRRDSSAPWWAVVTGATTGLAMLMISGLGSFG